MRTFIIRLCLFIVERFDAAKRSRSALMGDTSSLTDAEMDALEAYLMSL